MGVVCAVGFHEWVFLFLVVCYSHQVVSSCTKTGYVCSKGCKERIYCDGTSVVNTTSCGERFCDPLTLSCGADYCKDGGVVDQPFICYGAELFPNPFNCRTYYYCTQHTIKNPAQIMICPEGSLFDVTLGKCSYKKMKCQLSVPTCTSPQQRGPLVDNPRFFYICEPLNGYLVPHLYACTKRMLYKAEENKCLNMNNQNAALNLSNYISNQGVTNQVETKQQVGGGGYKIVVSNSQLIIILGIFTLL